MSAFDHEATAFVAMLEWIGELPADYEPVKAVVRRDPQDYFEVTVRRMRGHQVSSYFMRKLDSE